MYRGGGEILMIYPKAKGRTFKNLRQAWRSPGEAAPGDHVSEEVLALKTQCSPRLSIARVGEREWSPALTFSIPARLSTSATENAREIQVCLHQLLSSWLPVSTLPRLLVSLLYPFWIKRYCWSSLRTIQRSWKIKVRNSIQATRRHRFGRRLPASFVIWPVIKELLNNCGRYGRILKTGEWHCFS